jgi:hypothetical protein
MKPKTKTILFILLSFVLGIICGWFVQDRVFSTGHPALPDFQKMLTERLHLDQNQVSRLDSILDVRKKQMDVQRIHMLAMRDTIRIEIRKILNINQVKIWDEMLQEKDARDAKMRGHEPPKK